MDIRLLFYGFVLLFVLYCYLFCIVLLLLCA